MFSFSRFAAVAQKEFRELKRNRLFFLTAVCGPVIMFFLFAYGYIFDVRNIPFGVLDEDKSQLSRGLIDCFNNAGVFKLKMVSSEYGPLEKELRVGNIRAVVVIPYDLSFRVKRGLDVRLQILADGTFSNQATLISGYSESAVEDFNSKLLEGFFARRGLGGSTAGRMPVSMYVSAWYNPSFRGEDFVLPGVLAMVFMFFTPMLGALALAREKESGSILNFYCSCVTKAEYLLGKMFPYVMISYAVFLILVVFTVSIFSVPMRGDIAALLISSFVYISVAVACGLLVAVMLHTQIAALITTAIATMTLPFFYSGFTTPVLSLSPDGQFISSLLPSTYYIDIARRIMIKGVGWAQIWPSLLFLMVFCVMIYSVSIMLFKKRIA